jgi:carboxylesterase
MTDRSFTLPGTNGLGIMLIHGLTGSPSEMKLLAKRLNRRGFTIHAPQLAGHGGDQALLLSTRWRDWLSGVREAYDRFRKTVDEVSVAGVCVGGSLGLELAADHPEIRAAAVYSMTFEYDGWNMPRWAMAAPVMQLFAHLPGFRGLSYAEPYPYGLKNERLRKMAQSSGPDSLVEGGLDRLPVGSLYEMYRLCRHLERIGGEIRTPTLILHARDDDMSHPRNAYRLAKALGGPSQVRLLEDSYHMIHVDQERDLVAQWTADFAMQYSLTAAGPMHAHG